MFQPNVMKGMVIRGNVGCYFLGTCQIKNKKNLAVWNLNNTEPYGAGIFKMLLLLTVFIRAQPHPLAITFLGNRASFKNCLSFLNYSMRVNGKVLKYVISWKRLIVEGNGWQFWICGPWNCIYRVLFFMSDSLSSASGQTLQIFR